MRKYLIGLFVGITMVAAWASFSPFQMEQQVALNIIAKLGRKAWAATGGTLAATQVVRITKFGYNKDIDSSTPEFLTAAGTTSYPSGSATETLLISSSDADDTGGGTGARQILITGINEDGEQFLEFFNMTGTSASASSTPLKFINRVVVYSAGNSNKNEGAITLTGADSSLVYAVIPANAAVTQQLSYYVPSDQSCYIEDLILYGQKLGGGGLPRLSFDVLIYSNVTGIEYDIRELFMDLDTDSVIERKDFKAEPLAPNEIINVKVTTDTNDSRVSGSMTLTCRVL